MELNVIQSKCIACGKCYLNQPHLFDCNDEGIAYVKQTALPLSSQTIEQARQAIFACPTRAIISDNQLDSPN